MTFTNKIIIAPLLITNPKVWSSGLELCFKTRQTWKVMAKETKEDRGSLRTRDRKNEGRGEWKINFGRQRRSEGGSVGLSFVGESDFFW